MERRWLYIIPALLMLISCQQSLDDAYDYEAIKTELEVSPPSVVFGGKEQSEKVQITCNSYWTAAVSSSGSWLSLNTYTGKGNGTLIIKASANNSVKSSRSGVVTVSDGINTFEINVTQDPAKEYLTASTGELVVPFSKSTSDVTISTNVDWTASSNASWASVSSTSTRLTIETEENLSYSPRSATISIKGYKLSIFISVNQSGAAVPMVGEVSVSSIQKTSATCTFSFSSSDVPITRYGICYSSTQKYPTIDNDCKYTSASSYGGTATFNLSDLTQNTTYYVRPYVTTSIDTTYGSVVSFTTENINSPEEGDNPTPSY